MNKNLNVKSIWVWSFAIIAMLAFAYQSFAENILITKIEANPTRRVDYLDIHTTGYIKAKGLLVEDKLLIELSQAEMAEDLEISKRKSKRVKDIYVEQESGEAAQIVVELARDIDYEIINVFGRNKSVVEIYDRLDYAERLMAAWEKANLKKKAPALEPYKYATQDKAKNLPLRGKVIVIDPGHGGLDPGAFSRSGIPEKHLTLQTARKIASLLNSAGATVYLTRNKDRTVSIKDIVDFTNGVGADIFISIHYNFTNKKEISGTETYYYNPNSRRLALIMHQTMINGIKRKDRGLRRGMFYTIHHTHMPAILVEPLYLSNPEEEKLACSANFQNEIAKDIARGGKTYFRSQGH